MATFGRLLALPSPYSLLKDCDPIEMETWPFEVAFILTRSFPAPCELGRFSLSGYDVADSKLASSVDAGDLPSLEYLNSPVPSEPDGLFSTVSVSLSSSYSGSPALVSTSGDVLDLSLGVAGLLSGTESYSSVVFVGLVELDCATVCPDYGLGAVAFPDAGAGTGGVSTGSGAPPVPAASYAEFSAARIALVAASATWPVEDLLSSVCDMLLREPSGIPSLELGIWGWLQHGWLSSEPELLPQLADT